MLKLLRKAFTKENLPHKSLTSAVALLVVVFSGFLPEEFAGKEEQIAEAITTILTLILFFWNKEEPPACPPCEHKGDQATLPVKTDE